MRFMPKIGAGIGKSLLSVLSLFNLFAGVIGLIGFLVIGEWLVIVVGLLMMFLMPKLYGFVILPHIGLAALSMAAMKRRSTTLGMALGLASALYNNAFIAVWILVAFGIFLTKQVAIIPFLWAYAVATVPFGTMALQEHNNSSTGVFLLLIQVTSLAFGIVRSRGEPSDWLIVAVIFVVVSTGINGFLLYAGRHELGENEMGA